MGVGIEGGRTNQRAGYVKGKNTINIQCSLGRRACWWEERYQMLSGCSSRERKQTDLIRNRLEDQAASTFWDTLLNKLGGESVVFLRNRLDNRIHINPAIFVGIAKIHHVRRKILT
jgi:hypothetical protein